MQVIITSNGIPVNNIHGNNDQFIITVLKPLIVIPMNETGYEFDIYYQDGMELNSDGEYTNDSKHRYNFYPVSSIIESLDLILDNLVYHNSIPDEENSIITSCEISWNNQVFQYLSKKINDMQEDIDILNLYQYLHIVNIDHLVKMLKFTLRTEFIYPDDPISFSYALSKVLNQVI